MEAIPRLPMLSFDLKRSPEYVEFGPVLKQYIKTFYGEDAALYNKPCSELEQLRQDATQVVCDYMGCTTLKKYYAQLQFLQGRFPMGEGEEAAIAFTWEDVQTGRDHIGDIKFEQAAILYNIGSLHSLLGVLDTRHNAEGMKVSCTHFQCAAWAFEYLRDNFGNSTVSTDMSYELLSFHILLMLAQAQECILEKSMLDGRKNSITAKVAAQVVEFYRQAIKAIDISNQKQQINSRMHKEWRRRMEMKEVFYLCITYYYQGQQMSEAEKPGECLAYFTGARDKLAETFKLAKNEVAEVSDCLQRCQEVVIARYTSAKKDNDFVYHDKVPALESLPEIKGASLVKGIPFNPTDKEISGPHIFQKLVPLEAHQASSVYSEEKAKVARIVNGEVEEKDMELNQFMSSLQLDMDQFTPKTDTMPERLMEKCAAMSVRANAIKELTDSMSAVSGIATEVELAINEVQELIDQDTTSTEQFEEQYGRKKPNTVLPGLLKNLDDFREQHKEASQLNNTLFRAMNAHTNNLKTLIMAPVEVEKLLPPSTPELSSDEEAVLNEVINLMRKVNMMRDQRRELQDKFREQIHNDDITNVILTQESKDKETIYSEQLKKHDDTVKFLRQNLTAQDNILRALTDANAKFAVIRKAFDEAKARRQSKVDDLILSYEKYEDLLAKSQRGQEYNKKLFEKVNKTLQRCQSECKARHEERTMLIAQFAPRVSAPSRPLAPKPGSSSIPNTPVADTAAPHMDVPSQVPLAYPTSALGPDVLDPAMPSTFQNLPTDFEGPKLKDYLPFMKPRSFGPKSQTPSQDSAIPPSPGALPEPQRPFMDYPDSSRVSPSPLPGLDPSLSSILPTTIAQYLASHSAASSSSSSSPKSTTRHTPSPQDGTIQRPAQQHATAYSGMNQEQAYPHTPSPSRSPHASPSRQVTSMPQVSAYSQYTSMAPGSMPQNMMTPARLPIGTYPTSVGQGGIPAASGSMVAPASQYLPHQSLPPSSQPMNPQHMQQPQQPMYVHPGHYHSNQQPGFVRAPNPSSSQGSGVAQVQPRMSSQPPHQPVYGHHQPQPHPQQQLPRPQQLPQQPAQQQLPQSQQHMPQHQQQMPQSQQQMPQHQQHFPQHQQQMPQSQQQMPQSQQQMPQHQQHIPQPQQKMLQSQQQMPQSQQQMPQSQQQMPQSQQQMPQSQQQMPQSQNHAMPMIHQHPKPPVPNPALQHQQHHLQQQQHLPQQPYNAQFATQNQPTSHPAPQPSQGPGMQPQGYQNYQGQMQNQPIQRGQAMFPSTVPNSQGQFTQSQPQPHLGQSQLASAAVQGPHQPLQAQAPQMPPQGQPGSSQGHPVQYQGQPRQWQGQPHNHPVQPHSQQPHGQPLQPQGNQQGPAVPHQAHAVRPQGQPFPTQIQPGHLPQSQHHHPYGPQQVATMAGPTYGSPGKQALNHPQSIAPGISQSSVPATSSQPGFQQPSMSQGQVQVPPGAHYGQQGQNPVSATIGQGQQEQGYRAQQSVAGNASTSQGYMPATQSSQQTGSAQGVLNQSPSHSKAYGGKDQGSMNSMGQVPISLAMPSQKPAFNSSNYPLPVQTVPPAQQAFGQSTSQVPFPQHAGVRPNAQQGAHQTSTSGQWIPGSYSQQLNPTQAPSTRFQHPQQFSSQQQQQQQNQCPGLTLKVPSHSSGQVPLSLSKDSSTSISSPPVIIPASPQPSSLDELLSSSPNGVKDRVIAPKVLTDQERQLQKEEAMKNLPNMPAAEPYSGQGALLKLVADVEAFSKHVDDLSLTILGVSRLDSVWKNLLDSQDSQTKKQSMAIARCYPMKNREPDIMPYDDTRVVLASTKDDYINASWLNDLAPSCPKFIITQSPLPVTTAEFWTMVYEQGSEVLVQITSEYETGKKFPVYYPTEKEKAMEHGSMLVSLQSVKFRLNWVERILYMKNTVTKQGRTVVHLLFKSWPVSGFPDDVGSIVSFISEVHTFYKQQRSLTKPIIVHCGTGVGRSGVFVLVYAAIQELLHGNGLMDLPGLSKRILQKRRGILLKKEQLYFAYRSLLCFAEDYLNKREMPVNNPRFGKAPSEVKELGKDGHTSQQTHALDDIVFGSVGIDVIRENVGRFNIGKDKEESKKGNANGGTISGNRDPSVGMTSLPDVVQQHTQPFVQANTLDRGEVIKQYNKELSGNPDTTKISSIEGSTNATNGMDILSKTPTCPTEQIDMTSNGSDVKDLTDPSGISSSLAHLQDPATFTMGSPEKRNRITKANFVQEEGAMMRQSSNDVSDPLSGLDPLWSLGK